MEWMLMPLKRYADFSGRSRRMEFWMFTLFVVIVYTVLGTLFTVALGAGDSASLTAMFSGVGIIFLIFGLAILVPSIAVQVRRFHDQDRSGWFWLLNLIPYVGAIIVLVMMCLDGTPGPNRYGADPKGRGQAEVFA